MIAAFLWASCTPEVADFWENEPIAEEVGNAVQEDEEDEEDALPSGITSGVFEDSSTGLSVRIEPGWKAWPGAPSSPIRIHMEHVQTGAALRIQHALEMIPLPVHGACEWELSEKGMYTGLKHAGEVIFSSCWPAVPGDARRLAWQLHAGGGHWIVEVEVPGGQAGLVDEALELVLPGVMLD